MPDSRHAPAFPALVAILSALLVATACAQPSLDSLWPNADGLRFVYAYTYEDLLTSQSAAGPAWLQFEGFVTTAGGEAQVLLGEHPQPPGKADFPPSARSGLLAQVWRARPDLHEKMARRFGIGANADAYADVQSDGWWPLLLHTGYFMKTPTSLLMWQQDWNHATWTYLEGDVVVGATFTRQLLPELADDLFLHGTVVDVDATVVTGLGDMLHAVKVDYVIDYGVMTVSDEQGELLGQVHAETRGHVHYAPDIGPVDMREQYLPYVWIDCGEDPCPVEWTTWLGQAVETQTLSLTHLPVASERRTWGAVKSTFR